MSDESNTETFTAKHPIVAFIVRHMERAVMMGIMSGIVAGCHFIDKSSEKRDVGQIWQHSGVWTSNIDNLEKHEK